MTSLDMGPWLHRTFPAIAPVQDRATDGCWIAFMQTRDPEHNPPFYWLGAAFDAVAEGGAEELFRARLHDVHGEDSCRGAADRDQRAQDVLSELCAYAWTATHIGRPAVEPAQEGAAVEGGVVRLHVPAHDIYVASERLRPRRSLPDLLAAVATHAEAASGRLPQAPGRILYLDTWHERLYAQGVGYHLGLTEPLQQAIRFAAGEHRLGHVLTRPFQWGNPVEAWY